MRVDEITWRMSVDKIEKRVQELSLSVNQHLMSGRKKREPYDFTHLWHIKLTARNEQDKQKNQ